MPNEAVGLRGRSCEISSQLVKQYNQDTSFSKGSKPHIAFIKEDVDMKVAQYNYAVHTIHRINKTNKMCQVLHNLGYWQNHQIHQNCEKSSKSQKSSNWSKSSQKQCYVYSV